MPARKVIVIGLRILAVCLLFAVCFAIGGALAGVARIAQAVPPVRETPTQLLLPFLIFCLCVGVVVSYLILRSSWHGFLLVMVVFFAMYGISTVVTQVESIFFLSAKLPHGMVRALFLQGLIAVALFAPLAVLILGKWRTPSSAIVGPAPSRLSAFSLTWRIALLVAAFIFLYMFFGYYVAWQNPELRKYYGGPNWPTFLAALKGNWQGLRWIYLLAAFRALLYIAFMYPLIRMLRAARWESALAAALFLACWTTGLLLPNPLMPASVAHSHFWETLGFSLVFGTLLGWLLGKTIPSGQLASSA